MDKLMQTLFYYILDHKLESYYKATDYDKWSAKCDAISCTLKERLGKKDRALLEKLQSAYDRTQNCELEAMYLAAFDQCMSLSRPHDV